jgi:sugar lactone lactonase YvrE
LKGEKAGTSDVFATLHGYPDNVRTNDKGEFWVALHFLRNRYAHFLSRHPGLRKIILNLPIPAKYQYLAVIGGRLHGAIVKYSPEGKLLEILEDRQGKVVKAVSEVEEMDGKLWMGSVLMPFVAVY